MGGIVDPNTGRIVWTMHVPLEEQRAFYASHPPHALAGLVCTAIDLPDWQFDGHGEPVNVIFELACKCGSRLFVVSCWLDQEEIVSPIAIECDACGSDHELFDAAKHGYDAAIGDATGDPLGDDAYSDELVAPEVPAPHHVIVRFEFPSDHLGDGEHDGREPELFSSITILARDPKSGGLALLYESECA